MVLKTRRNGYDGKGNLTLRGPEAVAEAMTALEIDDAGWCFRTGPSGRIELFSATVAGFRWMSDEVSWGVYIANFTFLVGIAGALAAARRSSTSSARA